MGKGELPEPSVPRVAVELAPPPFSRRHQYEPSRHQPEDSLIDLIVHRSGGEFGPRSGEQALVGLQVSELGVHGLASYPSRSADSSTQRLPSCNCWLLRLMRILLTI